MTSSSKSQLPSFILASGSPRRKQLLQYLGIPFSVKPSDISEEITDKQSPGSVVQTLALRKADDIAASHTNAIILGADTIVVHENVILGKPETPDEAIQTLKSLSNSTHEVLTGIALIRTDTNGKKIDEKTFFESTNVTFGTPGDSEIEAYATSSQPMDKAGAYGIQDEWGAIFVKSIDGDYYNIVGLPLHALHNRLKAFAPELFKQREVGN